MKIRRVLLPTDLSESADRALKQAVELAVQHRAKVDILHVVTPGSLNPAPVQPVEKVQPVETVQKALDDYMARVEKEVFDDLAARSDTVKTRGLAVETVVIRRAHPVAAILERIRESEPDVVVMGTHGRPGLAKLLLGSVTARVLLEAPCPVLTVALDADVAEGDRGLDSILVPIDFTDISERTIEAAKAFVAPSGRLILQHVVSSPVHPSLYAGGVEKLFLRHPELSSLIGSRLSELYPGPSEIVVTEGSVVEEILEAAKSRKAQWIVMGTRGVLGSVTERVSGRAKVPVLAVK